MTIPPQIVASEAKRKAGRTAAQGGTAYAVVLLINYFAGLDLPGEIFGALTTVLTPIGTWIHNRWLTP